MRETVMVKHAVTGKELLNNNRAPLAYTFTELPEGRYRMTFNDVAAEIAEEIVRLRAELNMFRFEIPDEGPQVKHWYYVNPECVIYHVSTGELSIEAESQIRYLPDEYWA